MYVYSQSVMNRFQKREEKSNSFKKKWQKWCRRGMRLSAIVSLAHRFVTPGLQHRILTTRGKCVNHFPKSGFSSTNQYNPSPVIPPSDYTHNLCGGERLEPPSTWATCNELVDHVKFVFLRWSVSKHISYLIFQLQ